MSHWHQRFWRILAVAVLVGALGAPASALAAKPHHLRKSHPHVRILGFTTGPRNPARVSAIQAKPGHRILRCVTGRGGARQVNFVWRARGLARGARVGFALRGPHGNHLGIAGPSVAQIARAASRWGHPRTFHSTTKVGYTFTRSRGRPNVNGRWFAVVVVNGKVAARATIVIACRR
jgi:hypothetical protein